MRLYFSLFFVFAVSMLVVGLNYPTSSLLSIVLMALLLFAAALLPFLYFAIRFYRDNIGKTILWKLPVLGALSGVIPFIVIAFTYSVGINACQNSQSHCGMEMIVAPAFLIGGAIVGFITAVFILYKHS